MSHPEDRRAASDAVHRAQRVFSMYPMASTTQPSSLAHNMATMTASGRPASYAQPQYYMSHPPPYSEVDYNWPGASTQAVRLIQQQQMAQPHMQPQYFPSWTPPVDRTASFQPSPFAQTVLQQTIPNHAYPTPPPPSGPIFNSPASSSLANALGRPPQQFLNAFVEDRAVQLQATPKKRKSITQLESPTLKRSAPNPPASASAAFSTYASPHPQSSTPRTPSSSSVTPSTYDSVAPKIIAPITPSSSSATPSTAASVPSTPSTSRMSLPRKRTILDFVDVPPKPWTTPTRSPLLPQTPPSRRTGDRDERTPSEKLTALLDDLFEAEDSLPAEPTEDQIPADYFVSSDSGSMPLVAPSVVRKVTKLISHLPRPLKRMGASPKKGGSDIDRESLARMLRLLDRSMRAAQDIDPFPLPNPTSSTSETQSRKSASPSKKKSSKSHSPVKEPTSEPDDSSVDFDELISRLTSVYMSILAAESSLCLLLFSGHQNLHSEELLSACFTTIKVALDKVVYPFIEASSPHATHSECNAAVVSLTRSKDDPSDRGKKYHARQRIGDIFQAVSSALPRITSLVNDDSLSRSALSESLIISAVYIAIGPFFVAADSDSEIGSAKSKAKDRATDTVLSRTLGKAAMRGLRLDSLGLIRSIFAHHQDQRSWIIEEVLSNLIKLSESGKHKSGQFRLRDGRQIKTSSALLLQLIQTSVHDIYISGRKIEKNRQNSYALRKQESFASFNGLENQSQVSDDRDGGRLLDEHDHEATRLYATGLDGATKAAGTIVLFLSSRSGKSKATKNTNEAEYRNILDSLINDLLVVLFQPEWPAASLVLGVLCKFMVSSLDDVKSHPANDNNATKSIALDHLGIIAAKIRSTILKVQTFTASEGKSLRPIEEVVAQNDHTALQTLITAQHDLASLLCQKVTEDQAYVSARELTAVTFAHDLAQGLKQINLQLDLVDHDDQNMDISGAVHDPEALLEIGAKIRSELREVWKNPTVDVFDVISAEEADRVEKVAEAIGTTQSLRNSFQPILNTILLSLDSSIIFMRTKALRALEKIVTADATILSAGNVRNSIESHLLDSSPQVRDAAVELIGKYLIERPEVAGDYYTKIADRIADTGLAVRKRVIKLLKAFYGVTTDTSRQIDIATKLTLRLLDEDDAVKDLAIKTIEELWFPASSSSPPPKGRSEYSNAYKMAVQNKVTIIMGVSANFKDRQSPLEDVLHKIISTKSGAEAQALHQRYMEVCETLIDGLVDASDLPGFTVINCIRTTYLFTSAYPQVLSASQAGTLLPYLKSATTPEDYAVTDYLLKTFRAALPYMPKTATEFARELQGVLQPMIIKPSLIGGLTVLQETVACMCSVVDNLTHDFSRIAALLKSCNARLMSLMNKSDRDGKTLMILIFIVALLGEHCDFEKARADFPDTAKDLNTVSRGPIVNHIYLTLLQLYKIVNNALFRGRVLQCLGFLFRAHPTLMTLDSSAAIMDEIFSSSDSEAWGRLLKIFQDFLTSESVKHAQKQKASASVKSQPSNVNMEELVGNTDGFAESGVSSAVVQRYLTQILQAALSLNSAIQGSAIDILTFTVKQGLAHPLQSFPVIVSLETSSNVMQSNRAAALHALLHSKHASLLNTRYVVSARRSFEYQKTLLGGCDVTGYRVLPNGPVALLQRWYSLVREKRQSRQEFLKSLVKVFQQELQQLPTQDDVDFMRYMAENFSAFEYKNQEEVFTVVKFLTSVLSTTGMQVLETVSPKNLLAQLHDSPDQPDSMQVDSEGTLDLTDKIPLMRSTSIVGMVMLLKAHLKSLYALTEERCQKFDVTKKSAIGEKAAVRRHQKPISWDRLPFAKKPILTSADVRAQKFRFLEVWNEDGVHEEPEDSEELLAT